MPKKAKKITAVAKWLDAEADPRQQPMMAELYRRAEAKLSERLHIVDSQRGKSEADHQRLIHELEVHQIELEMQNAEVQKTRDELEVSLEKYTDLYDFAPVGYFTLDVEGFVVLVNLTGSLLLGVERSRLVGKSFLTILPPERRPAFRSFLDQVFATGTKQSSEFEIVGKGQPARPVSIEAQHSPNGNECRVLVMDISERKQAQENLRVSEVRYRRLFEAAQDGVLLLDPETSKITDANPFMTKLLGYPRDVLIGKELFEIGLLKDKAASREMVVKLKNNGQVRYEDLPLKSIGARHQEVEVVANLYRENGHEVIQCNIRDITERKLAADMVSRSEALLSSLFAQAPVGVYVVDARFRLQHVNSTAREVFLSVQPLIGRDFSEVIRIVWPKRAASQILARFHHTLKTGEPYQSPNFEELRLDLGIKEFYDWQIQRVVLPSGEHCVVCFFSDITQRVRAADNQRRVDILTASNGKLKTEIVRRQMVEKALQESELVKSELLSQSQQMQAQMRQLSHKLLSAQEEERKSISRELHDVIAQTLVGINVHLGAFTKEALSNPKDLDQRILRTQKLVDESVELVHRFARELRPTVLDDLGLTPALHTFLKEFTKQTGVHAKLTVFAGLEALDTELRTILFRVAQEALTNVARHAKANRVEVNIQKLSDCIRMEISDDGKSFKSDRVLKGQGPKRLGLHGMRERLEMVGGRLTIESSPGKGTHLSAEIPREKWNSNGQPYLSKSKKTNLDKL